VAAQSRARHLIKSDNVGEGFETIGRAAIDPMSATTASNQYRPDMAISRTGLNSWMPTM
jgi:hypothetical protein